MVPHSTNAGRDIKAKADLRRHIPAILSNQFDVFRPLWAAGYPILVANGSHIRGKWSPAHLDALYGGKLVSVIRVIDGNGEVKTRNMKLSEFFEAFTSKDCKDMLKVKVGSRVCIMTALI